MSDEDWVILGRISGLFGVQGWVRVFSHTEPREGILCYRPLYLRRCEEWAPIEVESGRMHGAGVVLKLRGCDDRDAAQLLLPSDIAIRRAQLPPPAPGQYYWSDLEGLQVITVEGVVLGKVTSVFATGANDVLVVQGERERLIPFVQGAVVQEIDLSARRMRVDWAPDF